MSYAVNKSINNGEKLTLSPKWIYNITNDEHDCGSNVIENYKAIQKYDALTLYDYPYINSDSDSNLNIFTNPNTNTSSDCLY